MSWTLMPKAAILFDIDGTLVDSNELHVAAWDEAFREAGHAIGAEAIRGQIGKGGDNLVPTLLPDAGKAERERLSERHGAIFKDRHIARVRAFPEARDLLARTRAAGAKVVLASSASREELDHYLDLLDARGLVDVTTTIDDVARSKPDPDIFAVALRKAGTKPRDAIVVGDSPYDMAAAAGCGMAGVGLLSGGFDRAALIDAGAEAIYADAGALLAGLAQSPLGQITNGTEAGMAFNKDIVKLATNNGYFQREVYLDKNIQIVLMSLAPGEEIGEETHRADQTTFFVAGEGQAVLDGKKSKVGPNSLIVIPQGTKHNIVNRGAGPLKLYSVYAPPAEEPGVAHKTKADAEAAEQGIVGKAVEAIKQAVKGKKDKAGKAGKGAKNGKKK